MIVQETSPAVLGTAATRENPRTAMKTQCLKKKKQKLKHLQTLPVGDDK